MLSHLGDRRAKSGLRRFWASLARQLASPMSIAAGAGAAMSFAQAPWPSIVALPALFFSLAAAYSLFLAERTRWGEARVGWAFGYGYFVCGLWWIGAAFDVNPHLHGWMKPFAITLLPAYLALFWAGAFAAAGGLARRLRLSAARRVGLLACFWGLAEIARGWALTGLPWGLVGYAWLDTSAAQIAAWIGPYGLTALSFGAAAPLGFAVRNLLARRWRRAAHMAGLSVCAAAGLIALGALRASPPEPGPDSPLIRIIQPNIPQFEKGDRALAAKHKANLLELTARPAVAPVTLVLWPEASSPYLVDAGGSLAAEFARSAPAGARVVLGSIRRELKGASIRRLLAHPGAAAFGAMRSVGDVIALRMRWRIEGADWWNSAFVIGRRGAIEAVYDKRHLVPFGEMTPFEALMSRIGVTPIASAFQAGAAQGVVELGRLRALMLICYEAVFPRLAMTRRDQRPDMILHLTNDAWFGLSGGPLQHLAQARFRAIEQGLPVYRSANTGVSAAIDSAGRLVGEIPLGERGVLDIRLLPKLSQTPYAVVGVSGPILILFALMICLCAHSGKMDRTTRSRPIDTASNGLNYGARGE
ncbi:MAG: apolipoprotein N-acyltransferase [Neomegalonema sp.]|nr:apolipoprotein N-acyltransferase [Neomegalonema sp.]